MWSRIANWFKVTREPETLSESNIINAEVSVYRKPRFKVGVVVPAMGNKKYVHALIDTIKSEDHDIYIFVVDNGSTDGLTDELTLLKSKGKIYVHDWHPFPLGVATAWNTGVRLCIENNMDFYLVLNSDLLLHPRMIDELVDCYVANKTVILATPVCVNGLLGFRDNMPAEQPFDYYYNLLSSMSQLDESFNAPHFVGFLINKDFIDEIGYFDENFKGAYFEDNDTHWRIIKSGYGAIATTKSVVLHFGSRSINEGGYGNYHYTANGNYFLKKHNTKTTDHTKCPGWSGIFGTKYRPSLDKNDF